MSEATSNSSQAMIQKNCFLDYDTVACVRSTGLCFVYGVTALACVARVINLHYVRHAEYYPYAVFYLCIVQCLIGSVEWVIGWAAPAALLCLYLRLLELLVVADFYLMLVCRIFHRSHRFRRGSVTPSLCFLLGYGTAILILGMLSTQQPYLDCSAYYWLLFSAGEIVSIQVIFVACIVLMCRLSHISVESGVKRLQKRHLAALIIGLQLSAFLSLGYHATLHFFSSSDDNGCDGVFLHRQEIYSVVKALRELLSLMLPIWIFLWVFTPSDVNQYSMNSGTEEILDPSVASSSSRYSGSGRRYRWDSHPPVSPVISRSPTIQAQYSYARMGPGGGGGRFRRSFRRPLRGQLGAKRVKGQRGPGDGRFMGAERIFVIGADRLRRAVSAPHSLQNRPLLAPIPEESYSPTPSEIDIHAGSPTAGSLGVIVESDPSHACMPEGMISPCVASEIEHSAGSSA